jgi:hypothetical protein
MKLGRQTTVIHAFDAPASANKVAVETAARNLVVNFLTPLPAHSQAAHKGKNNH